MKERQEGIASNKAGQSQVWQRRQAAEVCSSKATASRRAPRGTIGASEAHSRQRRLKTRACMATTATSGVASAKNAVCKARGYRPIEGCVKKVRLKHGRDRERTRSCLTAGHSRDSIRPSARPTLTYRGKEKRQTENVCLTTVCGAPNVKEHRLHTH